MMAHMSEKKLITLVAIHSVTVSPLYNYTIFSIERSSPMQAEFDTFHGKPIEDSNWYFVVSLLIGKRRANRWVKQVTIPLGKVEDG